MSSQTPANSVLCTISFDQIHLLPVEPAKLEKVIESLCSLFGLSKKTASIVFKDQEGDEMDVQSKAELQTVVKRAQGTLTLFLRVKEQHNSSLTSFSDSSSFFEEPKECCSASSDWKEEGSKVKETQQNSQRRKGQHYKRNGRKKKDPNLPKKPLSAFMLFSQDQRPVLRTESPDAKFGEIGKIIGNRWKNLREEERKPYVERSEKAKEAFNQEKSKLGLTSVRFSPSIHFNQPYFNARFVSQNKGAQERYPYLNKPKRPLSSFMLFTQKMRNSIVTEYPDAKGREVPKLLGEKWKNLSPDEKKVLLSPSFTSLFVFLKMTLGV
eukprot:TRINITY_DN1976_c0_g1_i1.p1 TRINITY_DN1976_c0_g1~~TRINITY_DN1976_c0_g1_i1.p1  ORF type:complete len:352 (-),score=81.76 TRINITY_DN1976_c0_g1_i1:298-1269(-)